MVRGLCSFCIRLSQLPVIQLLCKLKIQDFWIFGFRELLMHEKVREKFWRIVGEGELCSLRASTRKRARAPRLRRTAYVFIEYQ